MKKRIERISIGLLVVMLLIGLCACGSSSSYVAGNDMAAEAGYDTGYEMATDDYYDGGYEEAAAMDADDFDVAASESGGRLTSTETLDAKPETDQKLITTVNMTVETTAFDELVTSLKNNVTELGGYIESSEVSQSSSYSERWSYLTIRIPSDKLTQFVQTVEDSANVTYASESTEDVTLQYVDLQSHLSALRTEQETLNGMLEKAESLEDILAIQSQLTSVRYEIESYESQLRVMTNQVNYSTIYLSIDEVERETPAESPSFGQEIRNRFSRNLYNVGQGLRNFAIGFISGLPIIAVWVVIIIIIVLIIRGIKKLVVRYREKHPKSDRYTASKNAKKELKSARKEAKANKKAERYAKKTQKIASKVNIPPGSVDNLQGNTDIPQGKVNTSQENTEASQVKDDTVEESKES